MMNLSITEAEIIVRKAIEIGNVRSGSVGGTTVNYDSLPLEMKLNMQQGIIGFLLALDELGFTVERPKGNWTHKLHSV